MNKYVAIMGILVLLLTPLVTLQPTIVKAQSSDHAPSIEWQKTYGGDFVVKSSNLIQTSDGGYAFMDLGYTYQGYITGASIFKVDSKGNIQWSKYIPNFTGSTIIQTSDQGFEISGWWCGYNATLMKPSSQGNIQWNQNYSVLPNLGVNEGGGIKTSDGGFVNWTVENGSIIKTGSDNNTQWTKTLTYNVIITNASAPLLLYSVIETSDGAIAVLGVAPAGHSTFPTQGIMHLVKLEPFLPVPSPTQLPTPVPTVPELSWLVIVPLLLSVFSVVVVLRHRKTANLKQ